MSTSISNSFIKAYEDDLIHTFQRMGGMLRQSVRLKDGIVGQDTTFQRFGTGVATTKSRNGTITPMNVGHTAVTATLADSYAGDWVDRLDEAKVNIPERQALAESGAFALGRKADDQIITVLNGTTESTQTWTVSTQAAIRNSLILMSEALWDNDVPNDGQVYGALTPRAWALAETVEQFSNADFVDVNGRPFVAGAPRFGTWRNWHGVLWTMHTGLPGQGTTAANVYVWHRRAVGYATGAHAGNVAENQQVAADITWHGDRAAWFVNHMMSGGAARIDSTGIIEGLLDDTSSLPTS